MKITAEEITRMKIDGYGRRAYEIWRMNQNRPYSEKKEDARQLAIEIQADLADHAISYDDLEELQLHLYTLAKQTGLVREFKENGLL